MELSEFEQAKTNQKVDVTRVQYYFNRYKYRVKVKLRAVHYFRYCKTSQDVYERLVAERFGFSTRHHKASCLIDELKLSNSFQELVYYDFVNWRNQNAKAKITITANNLDCYVADLDDLQDLIKILPPGTNLQINFVEPLVNFKSQTVYHKFPVHKYRIYLRLHRLDHPEVQKFTEFIALHGHSISPALKSEIYYKNQKRILSNYVLLLNHHFVDVDHEHDVLLWSLRYPDLVRTVFNIEKR